MPAQAPKVLLISVHYRCSDGVAALLDSLGPAKSSAEVAVIVVDSSSGEEYVSQIRSLVNQFPNAQLLESPVNRGYFGSARYAFDHYLAQGNRLPDWTIVCNHDIQIDKDFFSKLLGMDPAMAGVIAPSIEALPRGVEQNPLMRARPHPLRWAILRFIYSSYGMARVWDWLSRRKHKIRSQPEMREAERSERQLIYAPHGAFFIFSRTFFEGGGFLDGNLFLYGEEIAVAEICRSICLTIVFDPSLLVRHHEHQTTGETITRFSYECQRKALRYLKARYQSPFPDLEISCQPLLPR